MRLLPPACAPSSFLPPHLLTHRRLDPSRAGTLCGKYDRDAGDAALLPGFGRTPLNPEAMDELALPSGVSQAAIDCRPFFQGRSGHVLSVGVDALPASGYAAADASVRVSGPVIAGEPTDSLFDVTAPSANLSLHSWNGRFERQKGGPAHVGLHREGYAYSTWGPNASDPVVTKNGYPGSWVSQLGCLNSDGCVDDIWDAYNATERPPTFMDTYTGPFGLFVPNAWRRHHSYALRFRGWFVPPFTAQYRFVLHGARLHTEIKQLSPPMPAQCISQFPKHLPTPQTERPQTWCDCAQAKTRRCRPYGSLPTTRPPTCGGSPVVAPTRTGTSSIGSPITRRSRRGEATTWSFGTQCMQTGGMSRAACR